MTVDHDESLKVKKDTIKFTMLHDNANDRYIIVENTYEYQKYFILEYDDTRCNSGMGSTIQVTQYVKVNVNIQTGITGRGERGIDIDTKEFIALKNIIHFNCDNPFGCSNCEAGANRNGTRTSPHKPITRRGSKLMSTSFYAKNPYGVTLDNSNNSAIKISKPDRFI